MSAPRWIVEALNKAITLTDLDVSIAAAELLERLPMEAMIKAAWETWATIHPLDATSRAILTSSVMASIKTIAADHDVVTIADLYQGACRALDHAGVPYSLGDDQVRKQLDLAERITWLAQQRPTRLELQRMEAEREQAQERANRLRIERDHFDQLAGDLHASLNDINGVAVRLEDERDQAQRDVVAWREAAHERTAELTVETARANALNKSYGELLRELEATRIQAAGAADDLDRERRAHQEALADAAATELRIREQLERQAAWLRFPGYDLHGPIAEAYAKLVGGESPSGSRAKLDRVLATCEQLRTTLDGARATGAYLEGEVEILGESRDAATGKAEHNERELVDLRRRFDDLQRDRDRLARDLNQMQGDLDTAERKLRDAERDVARSRHPGSW